MNVTFTLSRKKAQALLLLTSKDDVRPALYGAALFRGKNWFIGASDGFIALLEPIEVSVLQCGEDVLFIPRTVLDVASKEAVVDIQISADTIKVSNLSINREPLIEYPNLLRMCPDRVSLGYAYFDPDKLSRLQKALRLWNDTKSFYPLLPNGTGPAVMLDASGCGLIMPIFDYDEGDLTAKYRHFLSQL